MKNLIPTFDEFVNEQKDAEKTDEVKAEKADEKTSKSELKEADVKDKESFKEYVFAILKKQHGDDFDEKKAQAIVDGIAKDVESGKLDDWGAALGKIKNA